MTPEQLQEGARLLAAATPGPWVADAVRDEDGCWIYNGKVGADEYAVAVTFTMNPFCEQDAAAIAWLRTHAAELLADAARYQWVLDNAEVIFHEQQAFNGIYSRYAAKQELSTAIDAARASGTEGACS